MNEPAGEGSARPVVLDTNIVLDVFLFADAAAQPVRPLLETGELRWVSTHAMRDELAHVLDYAHLQPRLAYYALTPADVLAAFDRHAVLVDVPSKAIYVCTDADDQKFIDLAVAHRAALLSKDRAVLKMRKRLAGLDVEVMKVWPPVLVAPVEPVQS